MKKVILESLNTSLLIRSSEGCFEARSKITEGFQTTSKIAAKQLYFILHKSDIENIPLKCKRH